MLSNISLKEMGEKLRSADSILIFPHVNPDGDAIGSCVALCRAMRREGRQAWVLLDDDVPAYLSFMDTEYCTVDKDCITEPDVCICVDCSEKKRFPERAQRFDSGRIKLCIDHHITAGSFGDYYYIDGDEAATAQIIYKLFTAMGIDVDKTLAESLYVGICTDTGSFQHSNTTAETHAIVSKLFEAGIDHTGITVNLYHNVSYKRLKLEMDVLDRMELVADGKAAVSYVTEEMLKARDASLDDSEGVVDLLRNIEGVELAAFIKEKGEDVKVSMRAKSYGNVDDIAVKFGGGGHAKAAGCTLHMPVEEAVAVMKAELSRYWEK